MVCQNRDVPYLRCQRFQSGNDGEEENKSLPVYYISLRTLTRTVQLLSYLGQCRLESYRFLCAKGSSAFMSQLKRFSPSSIVSISLLKKKRKPEGRTIGDQLKDHLGIQADSSCYLWPLIGRGRSNGSRFISDSKDSETRTKTNQRESNQPRLIWPLSLRRRRRLLCMGSRISVRSWQCSTKRGSFG